MIWIDLLITATGALAGAWVGAHLALRKFKQERAFEARVAWYLEMVRRLNGVKLVWLRVRLAFGRAQAMLTNGSDPTHAQATLDRARQLLDDAENAQSAMLEKSHEANLFARQPTIDALAALEKEVRSWVPVGEPDLNRLERKAADFVNAYRRTVRDVAVDARGYMGLEAVDLPELEDLPECEPNPAGEA